MASGTNIRTFFDGRWHEGNLAVMRAADHGSWLGSSVFDGARMFEGVAPDLDLHMARVNRSARALGLTPTMTDRDILDIARSGLRAYGSDTAVYVRPMYWGINDHENGLSPAADQTGFALCLEQVAMSPPDVRLSLTTTKFRRPTLDNACVDAKAGCLYPNNGRMLMEARAKGFHNALVADAMGNVAETATANVFFVLDGVVVTPIPNGTFLAGITRARHIANLRADGVDVVEKVVTFAEAAAADEIFLSGNFNKVSKISRFDDREFSAHPMADRARRLYWDFAHSGV